MDLKFHKYPEDPPEEGIQAEGEGDAGDTPITETEMAGDDSPTMSPRHGTRGPNTYDRGARDTRSTRAHPTPDVEDPIPEVPIQPIPPVTPIPSVAPVPLPISPSQLVVPVTEAPTLSAAPMPSPEASATPALPTVPVGAEHFQ
ncbi:vegetative cell wall protein gp1-like [Magnolia sinica]|uniref:vegetative cell wall protein gp1-like n=1 Tax=Magnolia sinica TaxID=86752 RepID=UPI002658E9B0|nr:vegetative cell wall protein gp1-like [Magnolia sinica]